MLDTEKHQKIMDALRRVETEIEHVRRLIYTRPAAPAPGRFDRSRYQDGATLQRYDDVVRAVLTAEPSRAFSFLKLAEAMAATHSLDVGPDAIRRTVLRTLNNTPGTYTRKSYNALDKRFRAPR